MAYREERNILIFIGTFSIISILFLVTVISLILKNNNNTHNENNRHSNISYSSIKISTISLSPLSSARKCEPTPAYIPWLKVRRYIRNNFHEPVPPNVEGTVLKIMRCLPFLTICDFGECLVESREYSNENVYIKNISNGINIGYYSLLILKDVKCICTDDVSIKERMEKPWDITSIQRIENNINI